MAFSTKNILNFQKKFKRGLNLQQLLLQKYNFYTEGLPNVYFHQIYSDFPSILEVNLRAIKYDTFTSGYEKYRLL